MGVTCPTRPLGFNMLPSPSRDRERDNEATDIKRANTAETNLQQQHLQTNDNVELLVLQYFTDNRNDYTSLNAYLTIKNIFLKYNTPLPSSAPASVSICNDNKLAHS